MGIKESIILGIIQGLTEFLPISSSGHLEIGKEILGEHSIGRESMLLTIILHAATALSIIYVFWHNIINLLHSFFLFKKTNEFMFSLKIILSMIPASLVGFFWEEKIELLFGRDLIMVGIMLIITAILLFLADKAKPTNKNVSFSSSLIIGVSQAIAILPGISRSGATISTSVLLGIDKKQAAEFSFLMVVPLILGKIIKDIASGEIKFNSTDSLPLLLGFIAAFLVGIIACRWMIKLVQNSKLKYFSYYCILIGFAVILFETIK